MTQERIEELETALAEAKSETQKANKESADRRGEIKTLREQIESFENVVGTMQKKVFAAREALAAHNVKINFDEVDLSGLGLNENGEVVGRFEYSPETPKSDLPPAGGGADSVLSEEKIASMSPEDINKNWDQIMELSRAGALQ